MKESLVKNIIIKTYRFIKENCIGPQKIYFLYESIKNKVNVEVSFNFFSEIFDNKENITKQFVCEKIDNYNLDLDKYSELEIKYKSEEVIKTSYETKERDNVSRKIEPIEKNTNKESDKDNDDEYYYFTKTRRILKSKLIAVIKNIFIDSGKSVLSIRHIYNKLSTAFNYSSINMSNLKKLLNTEKNVLKSTVSELEVRYPQKVQLRATPDIAKIFLKNNKIVLKILKSAGLEFIKDILEKGLGAYSDFCKAVEVFDNVFTSKLELVDRKNDKLLNKETSELLLRFFNIFKEDELISVFSNKEELTRVLDMFMEDERKREDKEYFIKNITKQVGKIHSDNKNARVRYLFPYEVSSYFKKENIILLKDLENTSQDRLAGLYIHKDIIDNQIRSLKLSIPSIMSEKFKLILQRVNASNVPNTLWEKYVDVLLYREKGLTLEASGAKVDLTRERVRQIEARYVKLFSSFYSSNKGTLTNFLRSFSKNEFYLTQDDIDNIFDFYPNLFTHLLKSMTKIQDILFIEELGVFYFIDEFDWYKELLTFTENLEDVLNIEKMNSAIDDIYIKLKNNGIDIPKVFCEKIILHDFNLNGTIYSRSRMTLALKYKKILLNHFPEGIHIYDSNQVSEFRKHYNQMFDDGRIPDNDRAIQGRIVDLCYLRGRGFYKLKEDKYLTEELFDKIYNYIISSDREIFLTNTIYHIFKTELNNEGIFNKYHLQGAFREMCGDKLHFSRDYISKTKEKSSLYSEIYNYIKEVKREVTYSELKNEFIGVPDSVFVQVLSNEDILNYRKVYTHVDNLNFSDDDIIETKKYIDLLTDNDEIHHTNELFKIMEFKNNKLLDRYNIDSQYKLFSIVSYLYQDEFEFQRPFIARKGVVIGSQNERIKEFVRGHDEMPITELFEFVYSNNLQLNSIIDFVNSMNGEYLFKDDTNIISLEKSKITKYNVSIAEKILEGELEADGFIASDQFRLYSFLPSEVKWTDWLLFSALNAFSDKLSGIPSSWQMKYSKPIYLKRGLKANNMEELIEHLRKNKKMNEIEFIKYLKIKGLME